ncbi:hypothetical protein Syun_012062 [Stephania yunnanensis]|uniref:Uncharacterized protein n=1 Tax=Stephania yunnanensis TaxID=152371 RepID=A0AAP0JYT7_9MAGN
MAENRTSAAQLDSSPCVPGGGVLYTLSKSLHTEHKKVRRKRVPLTHSLRWNEIVRYTTIPVEFH